MKQSILLLIFPVWLCLPDQISAQIKHFKGDWTKDGTTYLFDFDLYIKHIDGDAVEGVFNWTYKQYDENDPWSKDYYEEKKDATAKEYVRGKYDAKTKTYYLHGYKKDDPQQIIAPDDYILILDKNDNIGGDTKAQGSWEGRINGKVVRDDAA
ncbi:MAG TPA: hypothetical protein ENJ95_09830 [Bacteroidetes bacterium]|nr:hypothetical protein [Bacteroidota bacterium]